MSSSLGQERHATGWQRFGEVYGEYGATAEVTLAMHMRHTPGTWRGDVLARWHPALDGFSLPFGLSLGGRLEGSGANRALVLLGAHLGQGFDSRIGNIWTRLDLQMQSRPAQLTRPLELSLSGQVGLRTEGGGLGLLSLTHKRRNGTSALEFSPVIGHEIGRARTLVLGMTARSSSPGIASVQLSLWSQF
ncbi:MAG: hypothetical protein JJU15_06505 [Pararhodobacter sp.]|nr:hypothetical protein [Pararhodobacter sp.]